MSKLRKAVNTVVCNESYGECIRERLQNRLGFSTFQAFKALDKNKNGFIGVEEIKGLLNEFGICVSQRELLLLLSRFDKNQDGKVSFNEFVKEIRPRSCYQTIQQQALY